jgi:hypothetical protein
MRRKNEQWAANVRAGKNPVHASRRERLAKRAPISSTALGIVVFVVCGGGMAVLLGGIRFFG